MNEFTDNRKSELLTSETHFTRDGEDITFRQLISKLLNMFHHTRDTKTINEALSVVLSFFKADRISLRVFDQDHFNEIYSYKAQKEGTPDMASIPEIVKQNEPFNQDAIKLLAEWIRSGKEIVIDNTSELPSDLAFSKKLANSNNTKSCLVLPTYSKDVVNGYIVIDFVSHYYNWKTADIENMKVVTEIFSNTIEHEKLSKEKEISALRTLRNEVILNMVFQNLPVGVELYDENGYLTRINKEDLNIFGTTEEKALGINLFENPVIPEDIKKRLRNGEDVTFEHNYNFEKISETSYFESKYTDTIKNLVTSCIPLKDNYNNTFAYLLIVHNNTEDYNRKKELEYNLTKLRMALDTGKALIWEYDIATNKLSFDETLTGDISSWIFMNADNSEMFTSEGQMEGVHPEDAERFYSQAVMPILSGDINQVTVTYRQYMGGKLEWLTSNFRSTPSVDGKKQPSKVFCYSMIVTEQRETELELIKIKEADRLKNLFMENLSHEIRTPLNAIVGFSNIIAETNRNEENEEIVELINGNNEVLLHIVENMLDLSKLDAGDMEYEFGNIDIKQMGMELYDKYSAKTLPGVKMNLICEIDTPYICSDKKKLQQIISHLLDNALKFTEQGSITLSFRMPDSEHLEISVADTGIGLTEEEKKPLFTPFYKADTFKKGTGLGLHISRKLTKALGGTLDLESERGKGSNFWFILPIKKTE